MLQTTDILFDKKVRNTFSLNAKGKSAYYMKGTEANKIYMDHPGFCRLEPRSQVCLGDRQGNTRIRYVIGASTIFEEDLYVDAEGKLYPLTKSQEAAKSGWKVRPGLKSIFGQNWDKIFKEEYKKVMEMTPPLGFYNGILALDKWGDDPILLEFVKHHECNTTAPNAEFNRHPHSSQFDFSCLEEEKLAAQELADTLDSEKEVLDYLSSLRTRKGQSYIYSQYNKNKIDATLRVFDIKPTFIDDNYAQKLLLIKGFSERDPQQFMDVINNDFGEVKMNIAKALALPKEKQFFDIEKGEAKLTVKDKKNAILKFETKDQDTQIDEVISYFLTLRGVNDYKEFIFALNNSDRLN